MRRFLIAAALIALPFPTYAEASRPIWERYPNDPVAKGYKDLNDRMISLANQMQKQLPKRIDDVTTLVTVFAADLTFVYNFSIATDTETLSPDLIKDQSNDIRVNGCHIWKDFLNLGGGFKVVYSYANSKGRPLMMYTLTWKECS